MPGSRPVTPPRGILHRAEGPHEPLSLPVSATANAVGLRAEPVHGMPAGPIRCFRTDPAGPWQAAWPARS